MKLTAQFNGAYGPVWLEVEEVVSYESKWGGFALVRIVGNEKVRTVSYRRLRVEVA